MGPKHPPLAQLAAQANAPRRETGREDMSHQHHPQQFSKAQHVITKTKVSVAMCQSE